MPVLPGMLVYLTYDADSTSVTTVPNGQAIGIISSLSEDGKRAHVTLPNRMLAVFALAPELPPPPPPPPPGPGPSVWDLIREESEDDEEV